MTSSKYALNTYKGERDAMLCRLPLWLGQAIREDAAAADVGYADIILQHLLPIYADRQKKAQELPMTG